MSRETKLKEIKSKPNTRFCTCGLEGEQLSSCSQKSCKEDKKHQTHVNGLVESGWLPLERWKHV